MVRLKRVKDSQSWLGGNLFFDNKGFLQFPKAFDYVDKSSYPEIFDTYESGILFDAWVREQLRWVKEAEDALNDVFAQSKGFVLLQDGGRWYEKFVLLTNQFSVDSFKAYLEKNYGEDSLADFEELRGEFDRDKFELISFEDLDSGKAHFSGAVSGPVFDFPSVCFDAYIENLQNGYNAYFEAKGR